MSTGLAYFPLDRVLTCKNLIYLLNLQFWVGGTALAGVFKDKELKARG